MLLALALLLPFLHKAHAVDDVTFLMQAQHVLHDPLHPTAFDMVSDGQRIRVSEALVSGPVAAYLLVPCVLMGGAEWVAHLIALALLLLAVCSTVALARRLGLDLAQARMSGLLLAATPVVIGMASTSMADVPAMAFGVLAMERLLAWRDEGRWPQALTAAFAFALAALARSQVVLLLPIGGLAMWSGRETHPLGRLSWRAWAPLLGAAAIIGGVSVLTADPAHAHGDLISTTFARFQVTLFARKFAAYASDWLLVIPLALPWILARGRFMVRDPFVLGTAVLAAVLFCYGANPAMPYAMAPIGVIGVAVLGDVFVDALRRADMDQLWLGGWLLLALAALAYVHMPAKYLVPSAPAAAVLIARLFATPDLTRGRLAPAAAGLTVALGAALSLLIVLADAEFTDVGRRVAHELIAPRVRAGEHVWYSGGWGSQWYAVREGATMIARTAPYPQRGDIVVTSQYTGGVDLDHHPGFEPVSTLHAASRFGRIMAPEQNTGFYSNWFGYWPWTAKNGEIESVGVWRTR